MPSLSFTPTLSSGAFQNIGGAVSDLFSAEAFRTKGQGLRSEAEQYLKSAAFAEQNKQFTEQSTAIQESQKSREINKTLGSQQAEVAASGFTNSGSALDIIRDSATQGALTKAILAQQGNITEAGYEQQAQSYRYMSQAATMAASAADKAAGGATIGAFLKGGAALTSILGPKF
jgi:hypothetical protein